MKSSVVLFGLILSTQSFAQEKISATLYELNSKRAQKLYTLTIENSSSPEGTRTQTVYKDLEGNTVVQEQSLTNGEDLKDYTIDRPQTKEKGHIEVRDGKVYFEYEGSDGKKKVDDEKLKGKVLCPANFTAFVRSHWKELSNGEPVDIRYAVWFRRETVGFTLQKIDEPMIDGKKALQLRMKASSFVIAALVDPIYLWYSQDDKKLLQMKGRVLPQQKVNGKWKDLDAETVYGTN
ncbi:MAG TPA: hypothetical protein VN132_03035 [Bdellovibrio sp.]|nr:hypothetical protein [Bdellovibrio sp.]